MADYERRVIAALKAEGCRFVCHGKGDHDIWYSPVSGRTFVVNTRWMRSRHTANETLKQAGLPKLLR